MYLEVRTAHILCAVVSIGLFVLRGGFGVLAARPLTARIWRILPHVVDSLLLGLGVWLAFMLRLDPLHVSWLGVKLLCVIAYIVLGVLAFRLRRPRWLKVMLFAGAIAVFGFIVSIAVLHDPHGVFALLGLAGM